MSIEQIVQAWKNDEGKLDINSPANPIGEELTEEALQEVSGGMWCVRWDTCSWDFTCVFTVATI